MFHEVNFQTLRRKSMEFAKCISCSEDIRLPKPPKIGMLVTCAECGAELEVVWLNPLELDWPFIDDDWDEEKEAYSLYEDD
jgi:alpha-aminoadipate carrier protein LysW